MIIYVRVSTAREDMISPELQEHTCRKYAREHGMTVVAVVEDLDLSGGDFAKRKIGQVIVSIAGDQADGVLVYRWDRFGRNIELSLTNLRTLEGIGGIAKSATEHFDTKTAAGRFARTNMLGVAELQREQIGEGWMLTHGRRLRNGLPHQGTPRFGYWYCETCPMQDPRSPKGTRRQRQKRTTCENCKSGIQKPHPLYGPVLKQSWERFTLGTSLTRIVQEIRHDGITSYSGKPLTERDLMQYMDNGFGAGYLRVRANSQSWSDELPESALETTGLNALDRFIWIPGAHEALISEDTWQAYLEKRKKGRHTGQKTRARYPASGLVSCINCGDGTPMRAGSSGSKGRRYLSWRCANIDVNKCNHSNANREAVDTKIFDWLKDNAKGGDTARSTAEQAVAASRDQPDGADRWEAEIERLKKVKKNLVRMRAAEDIDQAEFLDQRSEIEEELSAAQIQLAKHARKVRAVIPNQSVFLGLVKEWPQMPDDLKQAALRSVIWRITARKGAWDDLDRYEIIPRWEMPETD